MTTCSSDIILKKKKKRKEDGEKYAKDDDDELVNVSAVCRPDRPCKPEETGPPSGIFKTATLRKRAESTDCTR